MSEKKVIEQLVAHLSYDKFKEFAERNGYGHILDLKKHWRNIFYHIIKNSELRGFDKMILE